MYKPKIQARIKYVLSQKNSEIEVAAIRLQVTETLRSVMNETASAQYLDKYGVPTSPAGLRAVSVNAAKALMEMFPIGNDFNQEAEKTKSSSVVFNVVVPGAEGVSVNIKGGAGDCVGDNAGDGVGDDDVK